MIDIDLVEFDYHKPASIKRLFGNCTRKQEVLCQQVDKIILDRFELKSVEIEFGAIRENVSVNGFIGNDILSQFLLTINFKQKVIDLKLSKERVVVW